jgi:hypothetical protein
VGTVRAATGDGRTGAFAAAGAATGFAAEGLAVGFAAAAGRFAGAGFAAGRAATAVPPRDADGRDVAVVTAPRLVAVGRERLVWPLCVCRDAARPWLFDIGRSLTFEKRVQEIAHILHDADPRGVQR